MKLSLALAVVILAAYTTQALPIATNASLGDIIARSVPALSSDALVQLKQRGMDTSLVYQANVPLRARNVFLKREIGEAEASLDERTGITEGAFNLLGAGLQKAGEFVDSLKAKLDKIPLGRPHEQSYQRPPWKRFKKVTEDREDTAVRLKIGNEFIDPALDLKLSAMYAKENRAMISYNGQLHHVHDPQKLLLPKLLRELEGGASSSTSTHQ